MKLFLKDRLLLLGLLPKEGNLLQLRLVQELYKLIGLSSEELTALEVRTEGNNLQWNAKADEGVELTLTASHIQLFMDKLESLNKSSKLTLEQVPLYDMLSKEQKDGNSLQDGSGGSGGRPKPGLSPVERPGRRSASDRNLQPTTSGN